MNAASADTLMQAARIVRRVAVGNPRVMRIAVDLERIAAERDEPQQEPSTPPAGDDEQG